MVYDQPADQVTECDYKFRCPSGADDRADDLIIICFLVGDLLPSGQKFLDHIGEILRQCLSHFGTCVF